ncbi:acylphosphatase-2-like [Gigantopelta aegis]|uniref:acylphosphatase-2-like n=1 Tax=Gigantopelta aegis TaxID=1735272 RepID=UPI001B88D2F2|nr:acylphosphatase-2-like [Gigantopelta aegis]
MPSNKLKSVDFEVHGDVQGVFFRKYTRDTARAHSCVGSVSNTYRGTVIGVVQGLPENVEFMKRWLQTTGSPMSDIEKCVFTNEREITALQYQSFKIR